MIERLAELTSEPIVGRWYMVPTVRGRWWNTAADWPVLLPLHEDAEVIGFEYQHYHLDVRFLSAAAFKRGDNYPKLSPEAAVNASPLQISPLMNSDGLPAPILRRRRCRRGIGSRYGYQVSFWFNPLFDAHAGMRLKAGMVCPHKGICLKSMPVVDGVVECPGHGLRWNVATGEIVKPSEKRDGA